MLVFQATCLITPVSFVIRGTHGQCADIFTTRDVLCCWLRVADAGIRYEIRSGNTGGVFALDHVTGELLVAGKLDYETQNKYELRVSASDGVSENYAAVVVHVTDVNDNPPLFERPSYRTQITEEDDRNLPKRVLQVTAIDGDKDHPQSIIYFLTGQGIDADTPENSKFDINQTSGEIFVLKPLDRDLPNGRPQWKFTVFAQDENGEGLVGYADVQVNLKDINDNAPHFPQGVYFGKVTENGTRGMHVMTISAVDYDDTQEGANAQLSYSIEKNVIEEETGLPIFEIEPASGVIRTAVCCLDRERTPDYSIQVVAVDGGGLKGTGTASIQVEDINDMPPVFTKDEWFTEVDETDSNNIPDVPILTVTVHDQDEINEFQYQVVENSGFGSDKFVLLKNNDGTGSLKVAQPLDYEDNRQRNGFRFRIQVIDKSADDDDDDNYHVAYSWVVVNLRDINDNEPQFERPNIEVSVYENTEVGRNLVTFRAMDPDRGGESAVTYKIDSTSDHKRLFAIDEDGTVTIQRSLDHETSSKHMVRILAIDDGVPSKTATGTLTVLVQDINDNAPTLLTDYQPVLPENHPPQVIVELQAADSDDRSKSNGPPFVFKMDPAADDIIKASFKVDHDPKGAGGDGVAIISSLRSFDREQHKQYLIPIVIRDSGTPALSSTSTLTVVIGDVNDNTMKPDYKHVIVYNCMGQVGDSVVGRVNVRDLDDWDVPDKQFYWNGEQHPMFGLDQESGMISMRHGTPSGRYNLRFKVSDRKHGQYDVPANVTVVVREISHAAVSSSGSVRLAGITDEDFISEADTKETGGAGRSKVDLFRSKLSEVLGVRKDDVHVFSVQLKQSRPLLTDVRFAARGQRYYLSPVKLNGLLMMHIQAVERYVGVNISTVGIDECLREGRPCPGSCTNVLTVGTTPHLVDANRTALVGITIHLSADCSCGARNYSGQETCLHNPCLNGGNCSQGTFGISCSCPAGLDGPACQETARSFNGDGWAWFPPLEMCDHSHLSFEFITRKSDGMLLYNGPLGSPQPGEILISDFISVELESGIPRLLVDFGSGTLELKVRTKNSLDDGQWHRIDVFWDTQVVQLMVDLCRTADVMEAEDMPLPRFDGSSCRSRGSVPPFDEFLNVNTPLQVGGMHVVQFSPGQYRWQSAPRGRGFHGCIRNIMHNSKVYDMRQPGLSRASEAGCTQMAKVCGAQCQPHGSCEGSLSAPRCLCSPGWMGPSCSTRTVPATFKGLSYVKYALSFEPDRFLSRTQLRFRTRESGGELLRLSDQHGKEYAVLEITGGHLHFRYNLNSVRTEERDLSLSSVLVHDGKWHTVKVTRYGSAAMLELDGGEGRRFNETLLSSGHQWLLVDKQEGIYIGGKAEFTGVRTFEVYADYKQGCLDDVRLDGKHLPLPPATNGTQWGQATMARNLERGCVSSKPCDDVVCPEPFQCVDLWNHYECACGDGHVMASDGKGCVDRNECLDKPCFNGGICINQNPPLGYRCLCPQRFWGSNCQLMQDAQTLKISIGFLAAILVCLLIIIVLVFILVLYNRRRQARAKYPKPDEDVRENIISYDDEGGGEDDMTAFDIKPLQIPVEGAAAADGPSKEPQIMLEKITDISSAIEQHRKTADADQNAPPFDDLRNFAFEGGGSTSGSLSSLATETDENDQDFEYLNAWGPRFSKLSRMYGDEEAGEETQ